MAPEDEAEGPEAAFGSFAVAAPVGDADLAVVFDAGGRMLIGSRSSADSEGNTVGLYSRG